MTHQITNIHRIKSALVQFNQREKDEVVFFDPPSTADNAFRSGGNPCQFSKQSLQIINEAIQTRAVKMIDTAHEHSHKEGVVDSLACASKILLSFHDKTT